MKILTPKTVTNIRLTNLRRDTFKNHFEEELEKLGKRRKREKELEKRKEELEKQEKSRKSWKIGGKREQSLTSALLCMFARPL